MNKAASIGAYRCDLADKYRCKVISDTYKDNYTSYAPYRDNNIGVGIGVSTLELRHEFSPIIN